MINLNVLYQKMSSIVLMLAMLFSSSVYALESSKEYPQVVNSAINSQSSRLLIKDAQYTISAELPAIELFYFYKEEMLQVFSAPTVKRESKHFFLTIVPKESDYFDEESFNSYLEEYEAPNFVLKKRVFDKFYLFIATIGFGEELSQSIFESIKVKEK